jgi:hypothetical protein
LRFSVTGSGADHAYFLCHPCALRFTSSLNLLPGLRSVLVPDSRTGEAPGFSFSRLVCWAAVVNLHFSTNLPFTHPAFSSSCSLPSQCPQQLSGFGFFAARGRAYRIILPAVFSAVFPSVLASPGIAQGIRSCARRSGARCLICFCRQGLPLLLLTLQFVFCYLGLARRSGARCLICFFRQDLPLLPLTLQFVFCYLGLDID